MSDDRPVVIRTEALTKHYGRITAVDSVDLEVREGDVYGFLGANGSGKTTTVRMLLGLVLATSGPDGGARTTDAVGGTPGPARDRRDGRGTGGVRAPVRAPQPGALRRDGAGRRPVEPPGAASTRSWSGSGSPRSTRDRSRPTRSACGSGSGWRRRCCAGRGCSSWTSRPTASTRRASRRSASCCWTSTARARRCSCPATCSPRSSRCARGSACWTAVRLVLQSELADLQAPTGRVEVHTPDVARGQGAARRRRRGVRRGAAARSATPDPAALNARLVAAGIRVTRLAAERRTLEDVVLAAATASGDRFGAEP